MKVKVKQVDDIHRYVILDIDGESHMYHINYPSPWVPQSQYLMSQMHYDVAAHNLLQRMVAPQSLSERLLEVLSRLAFWKKSSSPDEQFLRVKIASQIRQEAVFLEFGEVKCLVLTPEAYVRIVRGDSQ